MEKKKLIRKDYFLKRKKNYFPINENFFLPLIKLIQQKYKAKTGKISLYYPSSNEVDVLKILEIKNLKKFNFLLPIIGKNNKINFYPWKKNDILFLNKYGIPEPIKSKIKIPNIILVPLLAYDKNKNRLGYGKGFYDKYLNQYFKMHKKILSIGIAFSFQRYHKLPINEKDYKLDYIITEKGIF